jgi:choline dehydrogenase
VLGGCSSISGVLYVRGQARDYDLWRQSGNVGWGWDDVLPYFKRSEDYFRGDNEGCGYFHVNQRRGVRWSVARGFLRPAMRRRNLTVLTGAQAERVVVEGRRATGIEFRHDGGSGARTWPAT